MKRPLDREEQDIYFLNITATDGLFVTQAMVEVTVSDVNDNSPVCDQVRCVGIADVPLTSTLLLQRLIQSLFPVLLKARLSSALISFISGPQLDRRGSKDEVL